jgi:hypothetical protein
LTVGRDAPSLPASIAAVALVIFMGFAPPPSHGRDEPVPPTFAKPATVSVQCGGHVDIHLRAAAPSRGTRYFIRSGPLHGGLGEILVNERGLGRVRYTHDERQGVAGDAFTYAAQNLGAAVSAREVVTIHVTPRPAAIEAPVAMDFGRVPVGGGTMRFLDLRNTGDEAFAGVLNFPSPWHAGSEARRVEIGGGEVFRLPVMFTPGREADYRGVLQIGGGGAVSLFGRGFDAIGISPSVVTMEEAGQGGFAGGFEVSNKTGSPLEARFEAPAEIQPIDPIHLDPGQSRMIPIVADLAPKTPPALLVRTGDLSLPVEIHFPTPRPRIVLETSDLDFGEIVVGKTGQLDLCIRNAGAAGTKIQILTPEWIEADPIEAELGPGEQTEIALEAAGEETGTFSGRVTIRSGGEQTTAIATLRVAGAPGPRKSQPAAARAPSVETVPPSAPEPAATPPASLDLGETRRQALRITGIKQSDGTIQITWLDPSTSSRSYLIEALEITSLSAQARAAAIPPSTHGAIHDAPTFMTERLKFSKLFEHASGNDEVVKIWTLIEGATFRTTETGEIEVRFPVPKDKPVIRLRISPIEPDGSPSPVKTEIRLPLLQMASRKWSLPAILAGLVVAGATLFLLARILKNTLATYGR